MRADVKNSKEGSKERRQARSAKEFQEKSALLCVYQQNPILATGDSSVISNYR